MSGKELSKLVAFVKGTQFDIVDFLQRERYGCAQLQNFAAGLELIGQKVRINPLVVSLMFKTRYFSLSFCCLKQFDN
jgi:hypothetical protein